MATAQQIEEQIAAVHAEIDGRLERAIALREAANDEVKKIRAEKDAAPRLHVKRNTKKSKVTVEGLTTVLTALDASLKDDEGNGEVSTLPELRLGGGE